MTDDHAGVPESRRAAREAAHSGRVAPPQDAPAPRLEPGPVEFEWREVAPSRPSRRRLLARRWIALGIVVLVLGGLVGAGAWAWSAFGDRVSEALGWGETKDWEDGIAHGEATVTIVSGDTGAAVSRSLFDAGITKTPDALYDYLVKNSPNHTFLPGTYRLQQQMRARAALAALDDSGNRVESTVRLPEGLTVSQMLPRISEGTGIPVADLQTAVASPSDYGVSADSLEGWLFPATYTFEPGTSAHDVISRLVSRAEQSLDAASVPVSDRQRILTIASIIQREARASADFPKVSRVIQNRLAQGMLLQMDSTAQYGYGEMHDGTVSSSSEALSDDNAWNTYVRSGPPAGPIANPGDTAIDAAMHPADGPWLYFVTVNLDTGETVFTTTLAEHEAAVAQWQAWCRANPNSGC